MERCMRRAAVAGTSFGIRDGYEGILSPERYPNGGVIPLVRSTVREISHLGGTILGTTNRGNPFKRLVEQPDGTKVETDVSGKILDYFKSEEIDALIAVGGDGSLTIAHELQKKGLKVVGVPKTIDNDLAIHGDDVRFQLGGFVCNRLHRSPAHHGAFSRARDGG